MHIKSIIIEMVLFFVCYGVGRHRMGGIKNGCEKDNSFREAHFPGWANQGLVILQHKPSPRGFPSLMVASQPVILLTVWKAN